MLKGLSRISTRIWLVAVLMTLITLGVGVGVYFVTLEFQIAAMSAQMPPRARAELRDLIDTGQTNTDRFYELMTQFAGNELLPSDWVFLGLIVAVCTAVGGGVALIFARRISRPIADVVRAAARVSAGDRGVRVTGQGATGELGELVTSFNHMASELEAFERERTVLTAGIAHELRTPLTVLIGRLHGLVDGVIAPSPDEAARLLRHALQLSRLVEDLRVLAHADADELRLDLRVVDPGEVLRAVAADLAAGADGVSFVHDHVPVRVQADPIRLAQVFGNLLTNAVKHASSGGVVETGVRAEAGTALMWVGDRGPGFREEDRLRMFEPFWRGAEASAGRPGSGLGLALAAKLVAVHGGRIAAANRSQGGARFSVFLPLARPGGPADPLFAAPAAAEARWLRPRVASRVLGPARGTEGQQP